MKRDGRCGHGRRRGSFPAPPRQRRSACSRSICPSLDWSDLGRAVKDTGFDGVDLTVRPGGHVLPERAADDLPRAIEAIASRV